MANGGARPGAGRPKGSKSKRTKDRLALVDRAVAKGITPLEVMLSAMQAHVDAKELDAAAVIARDAAPYIHPRLSAVDQKLSGDLNLGNVDAPKKEPRDEWLARKRGAAVAAAALPPNDAVMH